MDVCPFCHSEVNEDLARFGGTCPTCLATIPGEEAPTDPGEAARAAQEAADREAVRKASWVVPGALAVALVGVLGLAAWTVFRPEPVAAVLDFDDVAYDMDETRFVAYVEPETDPAPSPAASPRRTIRDLEVPVAPGDTQGVDLAAGAVPSADADVPEVQGTRGGAPTEPGMDAVADADPVSTPQAGGIQFGIDVGVSRRATKGVRLTDDSAIIEMIKGVLMAELPRLKSCYEQRLKVDEDLSGRWTLSLVVGREGDPRDIAVRGAEATDPDLERCIAAKVAAWDFQPIRADQPVQKTLTFRPGF